MSGDILEQIDQAVAEHEKCPCGRDLPENCPSFYWCSEACQVAWNLHQYDPAAHPHPTEIRERQDQIRSDGAAAASARRAALAHAARPVRERERELTTPVSGVVMWQPADSETAAVCAYTRWCPHCNRKQAPAMCAVDPERTEPGTYTMLDTGRAEIQVCGFCAYQWPGRPLIGVVEAYHGPAFRDLIRLRLTDEYRSATRMLPKRNLTLWREPALCLALEWEHLEEALCDGVTDRMRQDYIGAGRIRPGRRWDWRGRLMAAMPVINRPESLVRPTDLS